jgi:hypothetical protein
MSKQLTVTLTVGLAIPVFVLSRNIWPDPPGAAAPPPGLLPLLMVPAAFEALAFGAGVAFLVAVGRALIRGGRRDRLALAAYASAAWALVSWIPHSNMHRVNTTFEGLVFIDWVFHLTLIAGAAVVGVYLYRTLSQQHGGNRGMTA